MMPSLPIDLPVNSYAIEVTDPIECGMLRFGLPCSNDAYYALVCPLPSGTHRLIAVCRMCVDDNDRYGEQTWAAQIELLNTRYYEQAKKEASK